MSVRRRYLLFAPLGLLAAALLAAVLLRVPVAEAVLAWGLRAQGVPAVALTVRSVGLESLHVTDLRLGAERVAKARAVRVRYDVGGLLAGRVREVAVDGLLLRLDLAGDGPPLGDLQSLIAPGPGAEARPPAIPPVALRDSRIETETPLGPVTAKLDGEIHGDAAAGSIWADFLVSLQTRYGRLVANVAAERGPRGIIQGTADLGDGAIALPGAELRGLTGEAAFTMQDGLPVELNAEIALPDIALAETPLKDGRLRLTATRNDAMLSATAATADGKASATVDLTVRDYLGSPRISLDARGEAKPGTALWTLLALPAPDSGRVALKAHGKGRLAPLDKLAASPLAALASPATALEGRVTMEARDITFPERLARLNGGVVLDAATDADGLSLRLAEDARLSAARLAPAWLTALGVPAVVTQELAAGATLTLRGRDARPGVATLRRDNGGVRIETDGEARLATPAGAEMRMGGRLTGVASALTGDIDLWVALPALSADPIRSRDVTVSAPVAMAITADTARLRLRAPARFSAESVAFGDAVALAGPAVFTVDAAQAELVRAGEDAGRIDHQLALRPEVLHVRVTRVGRPPLDIAAGAARIAVDGRIDPGARTRTRIALAGGQVALSVENLALKEVAAVLEMGEGPGALRATLDRGVLADTAPAPRFAPLTLSGVARGGDDLLSFSANLVGTEDAPNLHITGMHRPSTGRGEAELALAPLAFSPDALQPQTMAPALAALRRVSGETAAHGRLVWHAGTVSGSADFSLDGISFETAEATVEDLNLALALDGLFPPSSPPDQRLTVRRIDPGLLLSDLDVRFRVEPADPPRLRIARGAVGVGGGRVSVEDTVFDPGVTEQALVLNIDSLDLARLFALLNLQGLSGEGRLSGRLPMTLGPEALAIRGGHLAADAPGIVRYRSEQARRLFADAGESADLLVRALENFHYETLTIAIDKPPSGNAVVILGLDGNNPDVLDGYPFRINVRLEGDTGQLLDALRQAYQLSNRMLRRAWQLAP